MALIKAIFFKDMNTTYQQHQNTYLSDGFFFINFIFVKSILLTTGR